MRVACLVLVLLFGASGTEREAVAKEEFQERFTKVEQPVESVLLPVEGVKKLEEVEFPSGKLSLGCCRARLPTCCELGMESLHIGGTAGNEIATQPSVYNPKCLNSVDFDVFPNVDGQPFCHEIPLHSSLKSASLEVHITSNPPCGTKTDRLCLVTGSPGVTATREWCTLLEPGLTSANRFCLDLEELGLLFPGVAWLLVRAAHHSAVTYLRLHSIMCQSVVSIQPYPSMRFNFNNNLASSIPGVPSLSWMLASPSYFNAGPHGTAARFVPGPANYLQMTNHPSQQGGWAMSLAVWVYFDHEGELAVQGLPIISKYGSYRWMVNPGQLWTYNHVHLGPGFGNLIHAKAAFVGSSYRNPIRKWLCLAVTIKADTSAGTTTLHYYLNGKLWAPPTVVSTAYNMDGTADLHIGTNNNFVYWAGKLDTVTMWQSAISAKNVRDFCSC